MWAKHNYSSTLSHKAPSGRGGDHLSPWEHCLVLALPPQHTVRHDELDNGTSTRLRLVSAAHGCTHTVWSGQDPRGMGPRPPASYEIKISFPQFFSHMRAFRFLVSEWERVGTSKEPLVRALRGAGLEEGFTLGLLWLPSL